MVVFSKPLPYGLSKPSKRTLVLILGTTLLLRSLPGRILHDIYFRTPATSRKDKGKANVPPGDRLKQTLQQIYEEDEQGRTWLLVPYEGGIRKVSLLFSYFRLSPQGS